MPPTLAIVGRPNVGKSTLFNRLTGSRKALTHDLPGVTRDRVAGETRSPEGGLVVVVDTGGLEPESEELMSSLVRGQVLRAIETADVIVLVVNGADGLIAADEEIAGVLRRVGRPVVVAVNKADRADAAHAEGEFAALGFPAIPISAEHNLGMGMLWEAVGVHLPAGDDEPPPPPELAIAIVGRPNAGKSSLLNRLVGEDRALVSEVPGTTRDSVDTLIRRGDKAIRLVDTAGIRRKGRTDRGPEVLSVVMARKAIERADVCVVVVDAGEGITAQDTHVAGYVLEAGRGAVVAVNKADLLGEGGGEGRGDVAQRIMERLRFLKGTPIVFTSALTGLGVSRLIPRALEVGEALRRRIGTGELNRVLRAAWVRRPPPGGKRPMRLFYATQSGSAPPRFTVFTSGTGELHFSYMRYLENAVRDAFPLAGVPVRFIMRGKRERSR